ncbi:hypothetical protein TNCV_3384121 [Trichonephila clavipes]|uniref:Uncharacterized protein n=1 Tax=Trichonephila clavipes TaxID=2585209 RepID=A0A8X6VQU9_TRICX|nr:hypothetical protein TNCV_3384121 [Trichonephila clavipes]
MLRDYEPWRRGFYPSDRHHHIGDLDTELREDRNLHATGVAPSTRSKSNQYPQTHLTQHNQFTATTHTLAITKAVRLFTDSLVGEYCSGIFISQ